jgi:methylase of polypeptide subunit release factors
MNAATRLVSSLGHGFRRPFLRRRLGRVTVEEIDGVALVVLPEVFNPAVFRTGALLARAVADWAAPKDLRTEEVRVLDLGTGSGVGALFAARRGFRVVAVDVNPEAARCARINALVHRLEERIEARQGDLFAPVSDERFDLVLFNPPFFRGEPADDLDRAWRGTDVLERFAAGLGTVLKPAGEALLVLSTDGEGESLVRTLAKTWTVEAAMRRDFGNEIVTAYRVRMS